jgi:hypothetical protein
MVFALCIKGFFFCFVIAYCLHLQGDYWVKVNTKVVGRREFISCAATDLTAGCETLKKRTSNEGPILT